MAKKSDDSELVTVRVAVSDLEALRLACQATGRSMASEIRKGIQLRLAELREDPEVQKDVQTHIERLRSLYEPVPEQGQSTDMKARPKSMRSDNKSTAATEEPLDSVRES